MTTYTKEWHYLNCMGLNRCAHDDPECPHNHFLRNEVCNCSPTEDTPKPGESATFKQDDKQLRELAEQFAIDFGISYDKLVVKKNGWVSYKTDTGGSGGWTEGTPAIVIQGWIILGHYRLKEAAQLQLVSELEGELPTYLTEEASEKLRETYPEQDRIDFYHFALGQVIALLEHKKQELERGK